MKRYQITVREVVYLTYDISIQDDDDPKQVFYEISPEEAEHYLINRDCFNWEISDVKHMPNAKENDHA
jgi:hypothetical protein